MKVSGNIIRCGGKKMIGGKNIYKKVAEGISLAKFCSLKIVPVFCKVLSVINN